MRKNPKVVAVVAGGTGEVGEGIVRYLLKQGATVIVPFRKRQNAHKLQEYVGDIPSGKLECIPGHMSRYRSALYLKNTVLGKYKTVHLAIASLGGWYQGEALHGLPLSKWNRIMEDNLLSHFIFAKLFLPVFYKQNSGTYVNLNGGSIEEIAPGAGIISIIGTALKTMTEVLAKEAHGTKVRVYSAALCSPVITRSRGSDIQPEWISAEQTGEYIMKLYRRQAPNLDKPIQILRSVRDI